MRQPVGPNEIGVKNTLLRSKIKDVRVPGEDLITQWDRTQTDALLTPVRTTPSLHPPFFACATSGPCLFA